MLSKPIIKDVVISAIAEVMEMAGETLTTPVSVENRFVDDLAFCSLMIAQLVMVIQESVEKEPFAEEVAISDIYTVNDMINAYCDKDLVEDNIAYA